MRLYTAYNEKTALSKGNRSVASVLLDELFFSAKANALNIAGKIRIPKSSWVFDKVQGSYIFKN